MQRCYKYLFKLQAGRCFLCRELLNFNDTWNTCVHHINHDHSDNRFSNRCLVHRSCHGRYHGKNRKINKSEIKVNQIYNDLIISSFEFRNIRHKINYTNSV